MASSYFGNDYFEAGADLSLPFPFDYEPQRKPSYDEVLACFLIDEEPNPISNVTPDSSLSKSKTNTSADKGEKKTKKRRKDSKTLPEGLQRGHWNNEENKRYHWFLEIYCQHFLYKHMRRMDKIFKTMEKFVQTREAQQCRSHHQKMEKKHGSFSNILKALRKTHYGAGDSDAVSQDMKANGVEFSQQLISWAALEQNLPEKIEEVESDKDTFNEIQEASPAAEIFIDPLEEFQCQNDLFLQELIG